MSNRGQRGFAFIVALLIASLVSAAAVALAMEQEIAIRRLSNVLMADRATDAARDLEMAAGELLRRSNDFTPYDGLEQAWAKTELTASRDDQASSGRLGDAQALLNLTNLSGDPRQTGAAREAAAAVPGAPADTAAAAPGGLANALQSAAPAAGPQAQSAPAGTVPGLSGELSGAQLAEYRLRRLCAALEIDDGIVQAILDWVDADTDSRFPNGAEDDYYLNQSPAYRAANRPFASPEELLLVRGVTPEIYAKLAPFVVTLPKATPVNVNTAPPEVLMALGGGIDRATANLIVEARHSAPFVSIEAFLLHPLLFGRDIPKADLSVTSDYFELATTTRTAAASYRTRSLLARLGNRVMAVRRSKGYFDE